MTSISDIAIRCELAAKKQKGNLIEYATAVDSVIRAYVVERNKDIADQNILNSAQKAEASAEAILTHAKEGTSVKHMDLINVWTEIAPILEKAGAIVAGGFVSAFIKWDPRRAPTDCDVWVPRGQWISGFPGWTQTNSYSVKKSKNMSPDVNYIREYQKNGLALTIQVLYTNLSDVYTVVDRFDFDVSRGILSPGILPDRSLVGLRATKPNILEMVKAGVTTYCEHDWDIDENGIMNNKALNRFRRYQAKGYKITASPNSRYTIENIQEMLDSQVETKRSKHGSYYDDEKNEAIPNDSLAYNINLIYRLGLISNDWGSPDFKAVIKLSHDYMNEVHNKDNQLPIKFKTRSQLERKHYNEKVARGGEKDKSLLRVFW